jgi:hypothetical protein
MVGAGAIAIAAFLPLDQPTGVFRMVEDNTLIQHGGWWLIALALGIAASSYSVNQGRMRQPWLSILLCVITAAVVIGIGNAKSLRTVYPVGPNGIPDTSKPGIVASLGIAVYVAGTGVAAALIGSLMLRQSAKERTADDPLVTAWEQDETKKPPDRGNEPRPGRSRPELEAEVQAAETEAQAAEARARAIRLRLEAEGKAKPASSPQRSKPPDPQKPKPNPSNTQADPNRTRGLKGFVQDWKSVPAWQKPAKPEDEA